MYKLRKVEERNQRLSSNKEILQLVLDATLVRCNISTQCEVKCLFLRLFTGSVLTVECVKCEDGVEL
jgi:hypothetical protein